MSGGGGAGSGVVAGGSSAGAQQDYGVFHGYANAAGAGVGGVGDAGGTSSNAQGEARDRWVIAGGTGFGYLTLAWTITGETALDGHPPRRPTSSWTSRRRRAVRKATTIW